MNSTSSTLAGPPAAIVHGRALAVASGGVLTHAEIVQTIARAFARDRIVLRNEFSLHDELARRLTDRGILFEREVRMGSRKRPDFVIGSVAIEIKIDGGEMAILRQLKRYSDDPAVAGVVLITTRPVSLPLMLSGKPLGAVSLWRNLL